MPDSYIEIPIEIDPDQLAEDVYGDLAEAFPGWEAAAGNLDTRLIRGLARMVVDLAELAADVPGEIFHRFGEEIVNVPPQQAASATTTSTWTMVDDAGYTIPQGTLVEIIAAGDTRYAFETAEETIVPVGETEATGVVLTAVEEGAQANGLSADATLIDAVAFVLDPIALESATGGGQDAESPADYRDRLAAEMQLLTPRPILPHDVEVLARRITGVDRAVAIDGYDPGPATYDHEKTLSVAAVDESGVGVTAPIKAAIDALLEAEREINFVFHVIDPTYTAIDVSFDVVAMEGFDAAGLEEAIVAEFTSYLSPANWGGSRFDDLPGVWRNVPTVRHNELIALVDNVTGVDYVNSVELVESGGVLAEDDVDLDGPAPLPQVGDVTGTVA